MRTIRARRADTVDCEHSALVHLGEVRVESEFAIEIKDLAGDGDHFAAHVVSPSFAGKTRVQQHKMVYDALGGRMGGTLHALALTTAAE